MLSTWSPKQFKHTLQSSFVSSWQTLVTQVSSGREGLQMKVKQSRLCVIRVRKFINRCLWSAMHCDVGYVCANCPQSHYWLLVSVNICVSRYFGWKISDSSWKPPVTPPAGALTDWCGDCGTFERSHPEWLVRVSSHLLIRGALKPHSYLQSNDPTHLIVKLHTSTFRIF